MCLTRIISRIEEPTKDEVVVWKEFQVWKVRSKPYGLLTWCREQKISPTKIGVWLKSTKKMLIADLGDQRIQDADSYYMSRKYRAGWHGWARKRRERDYVGVCIPVTFRRVHTRGIQAGRKCLVAYEMKIPKNWRKYV